MCSPAAEAARRATEDLDRLLPQGRDTAGHLLLTAHDGSEPVARVWVHVQDRSDGLHAFGYDLEVARERRHQGWGRAVLHAVEDECRRLGVRSMCALGARLRRRRP